MRRARRASSRVSRGQRRSASAACIACTCFCGLIIVHVLGTADMAASRRGPAERHTGASQASPRLKRTVGQAGVAWRSECSQTGLHWQRAPNEVNCDDRCATKCFDRTAAVGSSLEIHNHPAPSKLGADFVASSPAECQAAAPWVHTSTSRSSGSGSRRAPPFVSSGPAWLQSTAKGPRSGPRAQQPPPMHCFHWFTLMSGASSCLHRMHPEMIVRRTAVRPCPLHPFHP